MVRKFESDHGVVVRWTAEMDEYREAMRIANMGKQQNIKQEMAHAARERVFYLNTLANHAGNCACMGGHIPYYIYMYAYLY